MAVESALVVDRKALTSEQTDLHAAFSQTAGLRTHPRACGPQRQSNSIVFHRPLPFHASPAALAIRASGSETALGKHITAKIQNRADISLTMSRSDQRCDRTEPDRTLQRHGTVHHPSQLVFKIKLWCNAC